MRFRLIDQAKKAFPVHRLCKVLGVSQSGYFAWRNRKPSRRQLDDMVLLAHIRAQFATSNETGACPGLDPGVHHGCMWNSGKMASMLADIVWPV